MGQLTAQGVIIGMLTALSVATTMTSGLTDRSSLRPAVYVFALKSGMADAEKEADMREVDNAAAASGLLEDESQEEEFDKDKWLRKIRSELSESVTRVPKQVFRCYDMVPWARELIQISVDSSLEDRYYHVPRAAFIHQSPSTLSLPAGLHVENEVDPYASPDENYHQCYPQCPVRLRLLPLEPDRLWPRNLVVAECACTESPCSSRGGYRCRQVDTLVFIVRGLPGEQPKYCPEMVPAGCQCVSVRTRVASTYPPYGISQPIRNFNFASHS